MCEAACFLDAFAYLFASAGTGDDKRELQSAKNIEETSSIVILSCRHDKPVYMKHEDSQQKREVAG